MNNFPEVNNPDIYDHVELIYNPFWRQKWFFILCLFSLFFIFILIFFIKRLKIKNLSIEQKTLRDLLALKNQINNYYNCQHIDKFYLELTNITKLYIDKYFSLPSIGATDQEVIKILKSKNVPSQFFNLVMDVFSDIESAKFNLITLDKSKFNQDKMNEDILKIIKFVELTSQSKKSKNSK